MMAPRALGLRLTRGLTILIGLAALGLALIAYRFAAGLGAVTNLSDGYPWGFWIGIDILVGIALAAGGFVMAGLIHILGGHRFHALARPAILTALLGYLMFIFALMVDLGRPWHIWVALISWNHASPMFEVAWCVMFYTFVLMLEFAPAFLERFELNRLYRLWRGLVSWVIVAVLSLFTFAMTHGSLAWTGLVFGVLVTWEILMTLGVMPRDKQMPLLLIMAGIMLSTLHQSSLGTLFLISDKLGPLWYTPILPVLFFASAVMVGPAMVILEAMVSGRALRHAPDLSGLELLGRAMPYLILVYLGLRLVDIIVRGAVWAAISPSFEALWWWLEIGLLMTALIQFGTPEVRARPSGLFIAALATVLAVVVHRTGVAIVGLDVPEYATYVPAWSEVMITVGIASIGLLAFRLAVEYLPVYEDKPVHEKALSTSRRVTAGVGAVGS